MDLWEKWRDENNISLSDLFGMLILGNAQEEKYPYLTLCSKYIRDLYGNGFDQLITYRYEEHIHKIVDALICACISAEKCQKIVHALMLWVARCLPEEMLLGDSGVAIQEKPLSENDEITTRYMDLQIRINYTT